MQARSGKLRTIVLIGILSALVLVLSMISIPIGDISRIHFGNIMCLLSGMLFGPLVGGLSAGIGSMLYDFTNPLYTPEFWITFITKFAMGFVAGAIAKGIKGRVSGKLAGIRYPLAGIGGAGLYVVLYGLKSFVFEAFVYAKPINTVWPIVFGKVGISSINAVIAIVVSSLFAPVLYQALKAAGLYRQRA